MDWLPADLFLEAHDRSPETVWLDLDATDDQLHGDQEGGFFHGYDKSFCYLPLHIFSGGHLLCARLRPPTAGPTRCGSLPPATAR